MCLFLKKFDFRHYFMFGIIVFISCLFFIVTTYASVDNFSNATNTQEIINDSNYYMCYLTDSVYCIFVTEYKVIGNDNGYHVENDCIGQLYWYDSDTNSFYLKDEHLYSASENVWTHSGLSDKTFYYMNYDLMNDDVSVFQCVPISKAITKELTGTMIMTICQSGIKYLVPLLLGCIVLVIAFRKGWGMLKTVLHQG